MLLAELTATSEAVRATSGRNEKIGRLAELLRRVGDGEVAIAVAYLSGELRQRQIGVGWALAARPARAGRRAVAHADRGRRGLRARSAPLAGPGSQAARRAALGALLRARDRARAALPRARCSLGDLRQGALDGVMLEAVARAAEVPRDAVRRALMLRGDLGAVAAAALGGGVAGAARGRAARSGARSSRCSPRRAPTSTPRWRKTGPAAVEWKLDGARMQVHRRGDEVRVFTRSLDDVTARVPEVVEAALALPARDLVLDGEAIALRPDGRPHPFQVTASRFGDAGATDCDGAADAALLRPPARRRRGPARPPGVRARRGARRARAEREPRAARADRRRRTAPHAVPRRRARRRPRGRAREGARRALRSRAAAAPGG